MLTKILFLIRVRSAVYFDKKTCVHSKVSHSSQKKNPKPSTSQGVYEFARTAIIMYRSLGDLKKRSPCPDSSDRYKSEMKMVAALASPETSLLALQRASVFPRLHAVFPPYMSVS